MKRLLIGSAIVAVGLGTLSAASAAPSLWKVTGGGQIIASAQQGGGPGKTLAFTAQGEGQDARGQLQYNDHNGLKGHGAVKCILVDDVDADGTGSGTATVRAASIAGTWTRTDGTTGFFQLYVEDHDNGGPQNVAEGLIFDPEAEDATCDLEQDATDAELGRGNITIHKEKAPKA